MENLPQNGGFNGKIHCKWQFERENAVELKWGTFKVTLFFGFRYEYTRCAYGMFIMNNWGSCIPYSDSWVRFQIWLQYNWICKYQVQFTWDWIEKQWKTHWHGCCPLTNFANWKVHPSQGILKKDHGSIIIPRFPTFSSRFFCCYPFSARVLWVDSWGLGPRSIDPPWSCRPRAHAACHAPFMAYHPGTAKKHSMLATGANLLCMSMCISG